MPSTSHSHSHSPFQILRKFTPRLPTSFLRILDSILTSISKFVSHIISYLYVLRKSFILFSITILICLGICRGVGGIHHVASNITHGIIGIGEIGIISIGNLTAEIGHWGKDCWGRERNIWGCMAEGIDMWVWCVRNWQECSHHDLVCRGHNDNDEEYNNNNNNDNLYPLQKYTREFPYTFRGNEQSCLTHYPNTNANINPTPNTIFTPTHIPNSLTLLTASPSFTIIDNVFLHLRHLSLSLPLSHITASTHQNEKRDNMCGKTTPRHLENLMQYTRKYIDRIQGLERYHYVPYLSNWYRGSTKLYRWMRDGGARIRGESVRFEGLVLRGGKLIGLLKKKGGVEKDEEKRRMGWWAGLGEKYAQRREIKKEVCELDEEARNVIKGMENAFRIYLVGLGDVVKDVREAGFKVLKEMRRVEIFGVGVKGEVGGVKRVVEGCEGDKFDELRQVLVGLQGGIEGMEKEIKGRRSEIEELGVAWGGMVRRERLWCFWPGVPRWGIVQEGEGRGDKEEKESNQIITWDEKTRDWIQQVRAWCDGRGDENGVAGAVRRGVGKIMGGVE